MIRRTSIALALGWALLVSGPILGGCSFNNSSSPDESSQDDSGASGDATNPDLDGADDPADSTGNREVGGDGTAPDSAGEQDTGLPDQETNCANGRDDDGDGQHDCADPDCDGETCAPVGGAVCRNRVCVETACSDDQDNDLDGKSDCEDPDCSGSCSSEGETECYDRKDEDNDGKTDCEDREDCDGQECAANGGAVCREGECQETNCTNGIDDDGDGDIDGQDDDC